MDNWTIDTTEHDHPQAPAAAPEPAPEPPPAALVELCRDAEGNRRGKRDELSPILREAYELGASRATLETLRDACRVAKGETIVLPPSRLEGLSRGRGWARLGKGTNVQWGERVDGGYRVGPGKWSVGGTDGFKRKEAIPWTVKHVTVAPGIVWTVAD